MMSKEDDLQRMELKIINAPENAKVNLFVRPRTADAASRGRIKMWRARTKGGTPVVDMTENAAGIDSATIWAKDVPPVGGNANERILPLWVEGMELSHSPRDIMVIAHNIVSLGEFLTGRMDADTLDLTVIGPTVQWLHDASITSRTQYGGVIQSKQALDARLAKPPADNGQLHVYVYMSAYATKTNTEDDLDIDIYSYDRKGRYWQQGTTRFDGVVEEYNPGHKTSQDEVEVNNMRQGIDQDFLTDLTGGYQGFFIVGDSSLFNDSGPFTVVGEGGGRIIVRVFDDLLPRAGIRPPGWMVNVTDIIDLDIMLPIADTLMDEIREMTGYPSVAINLDDDDNDGGDAVKDPIPDKDDTDGVEGENDLLKLFIHKVTLPGISGVGKLHFSGERIAVYKDRNKKTKVVSGVTEFASNQDHTVYVEGRYQSPSLREGEVIVLQLWENGHAIGEDRVQIAVAYPMIVVYDRGPDYDEAGNIERSRPLTEKWLNFVALDGRVNPWIIPGTGQYYSVHIFDTERLAKVALGTRDAHVAVVAHGNYGMGILFKDNPERISDFMNVGRVMTPIRQFKYPGFVVDTSEYGDDPATADQYDPVESTITLLGTSGAKVTPSYGDPALISPGEHFRFVPGDETDFDMSKRLDHHEQTNYNKTGDKQLIVKVGSADLPTLRYKTLFLATCFSGRYYYPVFQHGALFYTRDRCIVSGEEKDFIEMISNGRGYDDILGKVNPDKENPIFDYHVFP